MTEIVRRTPKEVVALWVKALRSGKYKQGRGRMRSPSDEFCCLGVLYDLAVKDGGLPWKSAKTSYPPARFNVFLRGRVPSFWALADMNDSGSTFRQIADYIERYRGSADHA